MKSAPARMLRSLPSASILRKWISVGPHSRQTSASVVCSTVRSRIAQPAERCAAATVASSVDSPVPGISKNATLLGSLLTAISIGIPLADRSQSGEQLNRGLYIDTVPTPIIKCARHRVFIWMRCTNIDVEAPLNMFEGAPYHYVLEILSIRYKGHPDQLICIRAPARLFGRAEPDAEEITRVLKPGSGCLTAGHTPPDQGSEASSLCFGRCSARWSLRNWSGEHRMPDDRGAVHSRTSSSCLTCWRAPNLCRWPCQV